MTRDEPMLHAADQLRQTAIEQNQVLVDLISWEDQIKAQDQRISKKSESISEAGRSIVSGDCLSPTPISNNAIESSIEKRSEEEERKRGNELYAKKMYGEAYKAYTSAFTMNPKSVSAYSNRSMALLMVRLIHDCNYEK